MFWISAFSIICLLLASLTFSNLPFKGKTPNLSRPTISIPARAKLLAESPSVRIIVHYAALAVPASLASSSFGIPINFYFFLPGPRVLANFASSLALATLKIDSTIPDFKIAFKKGSVNSTLLPKLTALVPKLSFV